jgi:acyl-homoserine lactone acylase PvdQ
MGSRNGDWLSLKENNRSLDALIQSWLRTKAKGFEDFKKVMNMRSNSSDNTVFADDKGNIAYWHGNFMPKRDPKLDWAQPVDGTISSTEWKDLYSLDEMIHVYDPPTGWIQNCNSTPFTVSATSSPQKENYPYVYGTRPGKLSRHQCRTSIR